MRLHISESSNLRQIDILTISKRNDLVEGEQKLETMIVYLFFLDRFAVLGDLNNTIIRYNQNKSEDLFQFEAYHSREKPKCLEIFKDITRLGCDQQHVELIHGLIDVPNTLGLYECMLFATRTD